MNSGSETSTSLFITAKDRCTMRSKTVQPMLGNPNSTPNAISVNATGKPMKIAKIMMHIMIMPRIGSLIMAYLEWNGCRAAKHTLRRLLNIFEPLRPLTGPNGHDATQNLCHALERNEESRDRNHHLEGPDNRSLRRRDRVLVEPVRHLSKVKACPHQRDDAGEKKQKPKAEAQPRLESDRELSVEHIRPHMVVLGKRIGTDHHERRAVEVEGGVKRPVSGGTEEEPHGWIVRHDQHQRDIEPGKGNAYPGADRVDHFNGFLHSPSRSEEHTSELQSLFG